MTQLPLVALRQRAIREVSSLGLLDAADDLAVEDGEPSVVVG
jgi:hypothetical protein